MKLNLQSIAVVMLIVAGPITTLAHSEETVSRDITSNPAILKALETGVISHEKVQFGAADAMFEKEGMVLNGEIFPHARHSSDDYSKVTCSEADREKLWVFFHWLGHIWQEQNRKKTGYSLEAALSEYETYHTAVHDYEIPPKGSLLDYRIEQQAAIMADFGILRKCGDPNGWINDYSAVLEPVLKPKQ